MTSILRSPLWHHFGAAIDMLENAIVACPDALWSDRSRQPEYWNLAYHTLFFLDYFLSDTEEEFAPPAPFGMEELDPAGIAREQPYTKAEALAYVRHCRAKCRALVEGLTDERAVEIRIFFRREWTVLEWVLYNMRHVQHHAAQFNLILRQRTDSAPAWIGRTPAELPPSSAPIRIPNDVLWLQLGAAIDSLENAITACPDALWSDRAQQPEYWYLAYHTLFFLDYYLSGTADGFTPPAPFTLEELDPAGVLPERPFTKDEQLRYLEHGREKARRLIATLTDETASEVRRFNNRDWTVLEWILVSMRHVQHHTAQLNLILRQQTGSAPPWIKQAKHGLHREHP
ncbi:MAG TPA: DinB family protein [Longimicrobium sp.]|nr:DinB family protein [Longimicrobium sp.]